MSLSAPRTHDIALVDHHVKNLETFGQVLTDAAAAAFPRDGRSRYQEVHVLLLSWEDDNLGVVKEVNDLQNVFEHIYRYAVEEWKIPSLHSYKALRQRLNKFLDEFEDKESLLIVYYGGHGEMNDDRQCIWSCTDAADSATVQWSGLQNTLEYAESDVLILLDCCAAASPVAGAGSGVTEVIAACGFETWVPPVGEHSFTRSLIDELRNWSYGPPLSVTMLHNKVLSRIKYWKPRLGASGDHERRKTPIYRVLANEGKQRSIELKPLPSQIDLAAELPSSLTQVSSSNSSTYPELPGSDNEIAQDSSQSSLDQVWPDLENQCPPKVLISVALEEDQWLLTSAWTDWLRSIPAIVKYAHVKGVFKSNSVLILMSISVAVWNLLPKDPAITFIGFVKSWGLFNDKPLPRPAEGFKAKDKNSLGSMGSAKDDRRASPPLYDKVDDDESIEWIGSSEWADWLDATPGLVKLAYLETAYEENPLNKSKAENIRFVLSEAYEDRQK